MQPPLIHFTSPDYWSLYNRLPADVRQTADKYFALLKSDPKHPSLHLKKIGNLWSVRAGLHYRALGMDAPSKEKGILWFWIGSHAEYDRFIKRR
jgi:hypothetical protein